MSSTTHTLDFRRFIRKAETGSLSVLQASASATAALALLQEAPWTEVSEKETAFPPRLNSSMLVVPESDGYDAYKIVTDYADGMQKTRMGMSAYRFQLPQDAMDASPVDILSAAIHLYVDRWLVDGVRVTAYLSSSPEPPTDWTTLREGDVHLDAQLPMVTTPSRVVEEKDAALTLTFPASTASAKYLWIIISLEDYTTTRGLFVEGSAFLLGSTNTITFASAVTPDPPNAYIQPIATGDKITLDYEMLINPFYVNEQKGPIGFILRPLLRISNPSPSYYFTGDTDLVSSVALYNRALMLTPAYCQKEFGGMDVSSAVVSGFAAVVERYDDISSQSYLRITRSLFILAAVFNNDLKVNKITLADAIPTYPDWMRIKLNIYATPDSNIYDTDTIATSIFPRYNSDAWVRGQYNSDGYKSLVSEELSPSGYAANSSFITKPHTCTYGVWYFAISLDVTRIVAQPDPDIHTLGNSFGLTWQTNTMRFNI